MLEINFNIKIVVSVKKVVDLINEYIIGGELKLSFDNFA